MAMFSLIEPPELFIKTVLGFHGNGDDGWRLTLAASLQNKIGTTSVTVVPGSFNEQPASVYISGFGNRASSLPIS